MQQPPPPTTTKIIIKEKNLNEYPMGLGIDEINWNGLVFIANFILLYGCCVFPAAIFYIFFSIEFGTHRRRWVEHFIGACGKEFEKSKRKRCIALDSENIRARASQLNWNAIIFAVFTHQPDRFCYKSRIHSFNLRLSWVLPENEPSQRSHSRKWKNLSSIALTSYTKISGWVSMHYSFANFSTNEKMAEEILGNRWIVKWKIIITVSEC